ncbi:MAG: DNA gyrase subunit A [Thermodesulfobacteriota bacterium]
MGELLEISIEKELTRSYLDYALSVIIGRAIPDVRDGLKPVQRRVVFAMHEMGNTWNKPYKKSARIVGDVIGKYHPHGDAAVYDSIVRLAQDFTMRYPLVDGQGNFGSVDGDPPAAMRYTEVRLHKIAKELLEDIDKETVSFSPNYDSSLVEPDVLPSRIPNLLINGSSGIAVGMATNIPPHNLSEVTDALLARMDNPECGLADLMRYLKGPDFPTGGIIQGRSGILEAYRTGKGSIKVRARAHLERHEGSDRSSIVITELPYQVNKAKLLERIGELVKNKTIDGIEELRDESDKDGTRVVITLRRNEVAEAVLGKLFRYTQMEVNFGITLLAIDEGMPKVFSLPELLDRFLRFRKDVVLRRTRFELKRAEEHCHLLEGLKMALENLDLVLGIIRGSETPKAAQQELVARVGLSDRQAQAILEMRLQRLTRLEKEKILAEYEETKRRIDDYRAILSSEARVREIIRKELLDVKDQYGDDRRTEIVDDTGDVDYEDLIVEESMVVTITHRGYVKRTPLSTYRTQRRGGKGKVGISVAESDFVEDLFVCTTRSYLLVFTSAGRMHWLKVHEVPEASRVGKGRPIVNLLPLQEGERVATVLPVREFKEGMYIVLATRAGVVKKTDMMAFSHPRSGGIHAMSLDQGDELISAVITDGRQRLLLATRRGMALLVDEKELRPLRRTARGVRGIRLKEGDSLIALNLAAVSEGSLVTVTENGYGKRTLVSNYRVQKRGGVGVTNIKITTRNGPVVNVFPATEQDNLVIITDQGKLIRIMASEIKLVGRSAMGVKVIDVGEQERVVGAKRVADSD